MSGTINCHIIHCNKCARQEWCMDTPFTDLTMESPKDIYTCLCKPAGDCRVAPPRNDILSLIILEL